MTVADLPAAAQQAISPALGQEAELTASDGIAGDGYGDSVAISGNTVVVAAPFATVGGNSMAGAVYVFSEFGTGWASTTQVAKLTASDGKARDGFCASVAIDGNTIVVGSAEAAYVFVEPATGWTSMAQTARLTATNLTTTTFGNGVPDTGFGSSVAISGNTVVVGANNAGMACVFTEPAGGWSDMTQTAELTASHHSLSSDFGSSVSISGNTVVVGAYTAGTAYVFTEPAGGWANMTETAELTAPDGLPYTSFGLSVSISGNTVVVGAYPLVHGDVMLTGPAPVVTSVGPTSGLTTGRTVVTITGKDFTGATAVNFGRMPATSFTVDSDTQITAVSPAGAGTVDVTVRTRGGTSAYSFNDQFSMTADGKPITGGNRAFQGVTYVYTEPASGWANMSPTAELSMSDGTVNGWFGSSVSISGNTVVVGAASQAGYVYVEPSSGWANMTETATIPKFGTAAISGNTVVVGDNLFSFGNYQGSAYVFGSATAITSSAIKSATVGRKYSYQLTTNASASQAITFSLGAAPTGMSINASTGLVTWVPNVFQTGSRTVTVLATDRFGDTTRQTFNISVSGASTPCNPFAPTNQGLVIVGPVRARLVVGATKSSKSATLEYNLVDQLLASSSVDWCSSVTSRLG